MVAGAAAAGCRGFAARGQELSRGVLLRAISGFRVSGGRVRGGVRRQIERIGSGFDFVAIENAVAVGVRIVEIREMETEFIAVQKSVAVRIGKCAERMEPVDAVLRQRRGPRGKKPFRMVRIGWKGPPLSPVIRFVSFGFD